MKLCIWAHPPKHHSPTIAFWRVYLCTICKTRIICVAFECGNVYSTIIFVVHLLSSHFPCPIQAKKLGQMYPTNTLFVAHPVRVLRLIHGARENFRCRRSSLVRVEIAPMHTTHFIAASTPLYSLIPIQQYTFNIARIELVVAKWNWIYMAPQLQAGNCMVQTHGYPFHKPPPLYSTHPQASCWGFMLRVLKHHGNPIECLSIKRQLTMTLKDLSIVCRIYSLKWELIKMNHICRCAVITLQTKGIYL